MKQHDWQSALSSLLDANTLPQVDETIERAEEPQNQPKDKLTISFEKKGRGGKQVTIISGFTLEHEQLCELAATIKRKLGTGGSARGGEILVQGDRREDIKVILKDLGYRI